MTEHSHHTAPVAMPAADARHILYIVYWGLLEPLGQSLVLPAVQRLAERGLRVTLLTFEKPADLADKARFDHQRQALEDGGVRWRPLRYHKWPTVPATSFDILHGVATAVFCAVRYRATLIHARTSVGGCIGWVVARLTRRPWVFHNEGFWPDEQVDGGYWRRSSALYRFAKALDIRLHASADGLILLSRRSRAVVEGFPGMRDRVVPTVIVQSCVDPARFTPRPTRSRTGPPSLVCVGSLGGRYPVASVAGFAAAVKRAAGAVRLTLLSPAEEHTVRPAMMAAGLSADDWCLRCVPHASVAEYLHGADAGLSFRRPGMGALACSPTKVGEYWACGLPVVSSAGVGDIDAIVEERRVGVIATEETPQGLATAAKALLALLEDERLSARCRMAAEECYSLEQGIADQTALYEELASRPSTGAPRRDHRSLSARNGRSQ